MGMSLIWRVSVSGTVSGCECERASMRITERTREAVSSSAGVSVKERVSWSVRDSVSATVSFSVSENVTSIESECLFAS